MHKKKQWLRAAVFLLLPVALLFARHLRPVVHRPLTVPPADGPVRVVATIFPLADLARQVGGDLVRVQTLLPPGASPHTFEPAPREIREMRDARLFIQVGAGLDSWAERVAAAADSPGLKTLVVSRGFSLVRDGGGHCRGHGDHVHADGNPHVWLDPLSALAITRRIEDALAGVDPANAAAYRRQGAAYRRELEELHREITETTAGFAVRHYVSFHPAWTYFGLRYGLEESGVILKSHSREPMPGEIKAIVDAIREYDIKAVFAEPQFPAGAARAIADEAGVPVLFLDPLGGPDIPGRDSYVNLMRYNLAVMKDAMREGEAGGDG